MNNYARKILSLLAVATAAMTSCVNDNLTDPLDGGAVKEVPALQEQIASVEASVEDIEALSDALEPLEVTLDGAAEALDAHITFLKEGASLEEGALATLDLQKKIARIIGSAEAGLLSSESYDRNLKRHFSAVETGVKAWLGESFGCYYPVAVADAKVSEAVAAFDRQIKQQQLYVDALASDVEAGFRKDENPEELTALAASVEKNAKEAEELSLTIAAKAEEIEAGYVQAITAAVSDPSSFDAAALKQLNASVSLLSVDNSLTGLVSRVEACEKQLADIMARLGVLEETVGSLQELLGQIQSVTFMSEYSAENAIAYYDLGPDTRSDGKMARNPHATLSLNYIVRPAAAAAALTTSDLWDNQMKVFGYYAGRIEQSAVSMFDFDITGVDADATTGIVTVSVSSDALDEGFYFKETGAKLALSIATGKTDLTSKFVEVVPKDASSTVYIESLTLSSDYIEVDSELTAQLKAVLTPDDVTNSTLVWTTSDASIATVSGEGLVTAKVVGEATITVTTQGTDEWGQTLSRTCRVKVLPNIKLEAANYVEVGGTMTINVKSPNYVDPQWVKWTSSNTYYATVDEDGVVTGAVSTYNTTDNVYDNITITCTIGDYMPTVLTHTMPVVVPQPKGVRFNSLDDGVEQTTIKIAEEFSLAGSIIPDAAASNFRLHYQSAGGGNDAVAEINHSTGAVTAKSPGSVTFMARVLENDQKYYYPRGTEVWRWVTVNVEPYYVESVSLPETYKMTPGQTVKLTPTFTSDASGVQPTFTDLTWSSSNTEYATVDPETGEITSIKDGTVTITATTSSEWSVPEGQDQKSASCVVTIKAAEVEVNIGDFFYSDGTWSTEYNSSKEVIGIVFSKASAAASDGKMQIDYPACSNGLVVSTKKYSSDLGYINNSTNITNNTGQWIYNNMNSYDITDVTIPNGYSNTLVLASYSETIGYNADYSRYYAEMFRSDSGLLASHNVTLPAEKTSPWYIPSFFEMKELATNIDKVNEALGKVTGADQISTGLHWTSTLKNNGYANYYDSYTYPFNVSSCGWNSTSKTWDDELDVRVIFAF